MRLIVAITGASGSIYGVRLLELLSAQNIETHLVISEAGEKNSRGQYPKKSINGKALARLAAIAELVNGAVEE